MPLALWLRHIFFSGASLMIYRFTRTIAVCVLAATLSSGLVTAGSPSASLQQFELARELYFRGADGDNEATLNSMRIFKTLSVRTPEDPLIASYLGSNTLLQSGRTLALWKKGRLAREGLTLLDKAVSKAPGNIEIRFVRAMSTFQLPSFFKREQQCHEDLAAIAPGIRAAVDSGVLGKKIGAAALFFHGIIRQRKGDHQGAADAWRLAAALAPDTPAGVDAAKKLRGD